MNEKVEKKETKESRLKRDRPFGLPRRMMRKKVRYHEIKTTFLVIVADECSLVVELQLYAVRQFHIVTVTLLVNLHH